MTGFSAGLAASVSELYTWIGDNKDQLSVLITAVGIPVLLWQITQGARQEHARLRREKVIAKASFPLTLAALSEFGQDMIEALLPLERWLEKGQEGKPPAFTGPRLLSETIVGVEKVIAAYPTDHIAKALAAVLGEVQILQARSRDYADKPESVRIWSVAMKDNIVMAASIVARCQNLFDFAREGDDVAQPSRSHIQMILGAAHASQDFYPRVWKATEIYPEDDAISSRHGERPARLRGIFGPRW